MRSIRMLPWLLTLAACGSVEWQQRPTQDTWRGASIWATDIVKIAAREQDSAAEMVGLYGELCEAFTAVGEMPPTAPLILVVDAGDAPLLGDAMRTLQQLQSWHDSIVSAGIERGEGGEGRGRYMTRNGAPGPMSDAPPELMDKMAAVFAAAVPIAAAELDLPQTWQALATWCIVMPSTAARADAVDAMFEFAMSRPEVTFTQRMLMAPLLPWIRSKMRAKFHEVICRQLVQASCAPSVLGRPVREQTKARLLEQMGVVPDGSEAWAATAELEAERARGAR